MQHKEENKNASHRVTQDRIKNQIYKIEDSLYKEINI